MSEPPSASSLPRRRPGARRRLRDLGSRAPGFGFHAVAITLCGVVLVAASRPGWTKPFGVVAGVALLVLAAVWLVRVAAFLTIERRWSGLLAIGPLAAVLTVALLATNTTLHARWDLAESRFDDARADLPSDLAQRPIAYEPATRIGSYLVARIIQDEQTIRFDLGGRCGGSGPCQDGFAFLLTPRTTRAELEDRYGWERTVDLADGWYAYVLAD